VRLYRRLIFLSLFLTLLASNNLISQPISTPKNFHYTGIVLDVGTNQPIMGAVVQVRQFARMGSKSVVVKKLDGSFASAMTLLATIHSDANGAFTFSAPTDAGLAVSASHPDFLLTDDSGSEFANPLVIHPTTDPALASSFEPLRLGLSRAASLAGILVSDTDGQPLANYRVGLVSAQPRKGVIRPIPMAWSTTDSQGAFKLPVVAGKYIVVAAPKQASQLTIADRTPSTPEDRSPSIQDRIWYTDEELPSAPYVVVDGSQAVDIGLVKVPRSRLGKLKIDLQDHQCTAHDLTSVALVKHSVWRDSVSSWQVVSSNVTCGGVALIDGLVPGKYLVNAKVSDRSASATNSWQQPLRRSGFKTIDLISGWNQVSIPVTEPANVSLKLKLDGDSEKESEKNSPPNKTRAPNIQLSASLLTEPFSFQPDMGAQRIQISTDVSTRIQLSAGQWFIKFNGNEQWTLKRILHNGSVVFDSEPANGLSSHLGVVTIQDNIPLNDLTLLVGRTSGTEVYGVVVDPDGKPISQAHLYLVPESRKTNAHEVAMVSVANADGSFKIQDAALTAGSYRLLAIRKSDVRHLDAPGALESAMRNGVAVKVGALALDVGRVRAIPLSNPFTSK
jgi:hypothetical protein